jgi:hypothetical protein
VREGWLASALDFLFPAARFARTKMAQIIKSEKTRPMSVVPEWTNRVTADGFDAAQLETQDRVNWRRSLKMLVAHGLAFARGARTMTAQVFERKNTFVSVLPNNGEKLVDLLDVAGTHDKKTEIRISKSEGKLGN